MNYGFCDLCVQATNNKETLKETLWKLYNVGYNTVVINKNVDENVFDSDKKKKKKVDDNETMISSMLEPMNIEDIIQEFEGKLQILKRITFSFSDPVKTHSLNQLTVLKKYNLYGVIPKTQIALQHACSQLNVDIITINSSCSQVKLSRKLYHQAVEKGIHFEIHYSDVINNNTRKFAIHYSHLLYIYGKSKNVIISSGATNQSLIRNPYDIINLARLLGLNPLNAKFSILQQAHHALLKGEGRRYGKSLFRVYHQITDELESDGTKPKKMKA